MIEIEIVPNEIFSLFKKKDTLHFILLNRLETLRCVYTKRMNGEFRKYKIVDNKIDQLLVISFGTHLMLCEKCRSLTCAVERNSSRQIVNIKCQSVEMTKEV